MAEKSGKYEALEDLQYGFKSGHIIVGETLFGVDKGTIVDSWDLKGGPPEEMAKQAREVADLSNRHRIVIDTEGVYDENIIADEGELLTPYESYERMDDEEKEDYDSFCEHCLGL
ncbi:MAG: hypothetical protein IJH12_01130 [Clostridia bacterium]|nr:hypothetical protein [Clostridia bacterium]